MNELEMAIKLGMVSEPVQNRVEIDPLLQAELSYLSHIFDVVNGQKKAMGSLNPDIWCELLPWHSMN